MKIYIVTSGEYSDYSIRGVYLDRAKAEAFKVEHDAKTKRAEAAIEEWDEGPAPGMLQWHAFMRDTGVIDAFEERECHTLNSVQTEFGSILYSVNVYAEDLKSALKIASEKIQQFRAQEPPATPS